jgi:antitoxin ParD1/3/4
MATMNVSLPGPLKAWVEAQAQTGRYSNTSDYVRELIRRDQERSAKIARLQTLITEGEASESTGPLDVEAFLADMRKRHGGEAA